MVFVYRGAGKKQRKDADVCQKDRRCQQLACDIQWCLSRNNYQQRKCGDFVERYNECCERAVKGAMRRAADAAGAGATTEGAGAG